MNTRHHSQCGSPVRACLPAPAAVRPKQDAPTERIRVFTDNVQARASVGALEGTRMEPYLIPCSGLRGGDCPQCVSSPCVCARSPRETATYYTGTVFALSGYIGPAYGSGRMVGWSGHTDTAPKSSLKVCGCNCLQL